MSNVRYINVLFRLIINNECTVTFLSNVRILMYTNTYCTMTQLSFDFDNPKQFVLFGVNDFKEHGGGEVHYVFSQYPFMFWVMTVDEKVIGVTGVDRSELNTFELDAPVTDKQYDTHMVDVVLMNSPKYMSRLQYLVDIKPVKFGFK
jgi:hypothetical protein